MARKRLEVESWYKAPQSEVCPLCERVIPSSQLDEHHLVPKLKGGRETVGLHRICHRQIHALFSEAELAQKYNTADALLTHPEILRFVQWVKSKPDDFYERSKLSNSRK